MKIKEIISLYEALSYLVKIDSENIFKFGVKTRLNLLKNYTRIKDSYNYYLDMRDSLIKENNPTILQDENGNSVISLEDNNGKDFINKLNELLETNEEIDILKLTYEEILNEDNEIPLKILDKLRHIIK